MKNVEELPPLLLRSKEQEDQVISARAGQILIPEVTDSQEITPTPVFAVSTVAQQSSTPVNCQLKHQTSPIETKTANEPDSDSSDMETGGQDMREPMRVEMALGKTNADTSAQTDAQGSSKMVCFSLPVLYSGCSMYSRQIPVNERYTVRWADRQTDSRYCIWVNQL